MQILLLFVTVLVINIFFGAWRVNTKKFSVQWFAAIHVPIPFMFWLRRSLELSALFIPLSLIAAIAGQIIGGMVYQKITASN